MGSGGITQTKTKREERDCTDEVSLHTEFKPSKKLLPRVLKLNWAVTEDNNLFSYYL